MHSDAELQWHKDAAFRIADRTAELWPMLCDEGILIERMSRASRPNHSVWFLLQSRIATLQAVPCTDGASRIQHFSWSFQMRLLD
eukprot:3569318-Pleurochrysis_carterae.AAC.4